jgi:predicted porin
MKRLSNTGAQILIALSCGTATGAWAQGTVQITGLMDVYVGALKRSGDAERTRVVNSNGMSTSYWGFTGTEDLGGGLKAHFALTGFIRPDVGATGRSPTDSTFARDANVSISGSFGRLTVGRGLAPNFVPSVVLNPFGGVGPFAPLMAHTIVPSGGYVGQRWVPTVAGDTGWSNEIIYSTPDLAGFTANLFYQLGEQTGSNGKNNLGANAMYRSGALVLGTYFQRVRVNNPVDTTVGDSQVFNFRPYNSITRQSYALAPARQQDTWFVGGSYDFKVVKVFGTYQVADHDLPSGLAASRFDLKASTAQVGASVPVGNGQLLASMAQTKVKADADYAAIFGAAGWRSSVRRKTASIGYDYFLSKRTDVYGAVMHDRISDMSGETSFGVGVRHRF